MSNRLKESFERIVQTAVQNVRVGRDFIIESISQTINIIIQIPTDHQQDDLKARQHLLKDLKKELENTLKDSFYENNQINLEKEWQSSEVESQRFKKAPIAPPKSKRLSSKKKMIDIFDEASKKLLILGKPGAGKTIAVTKLALQLIERAENTVNEPIPILLDLVGWKPSQPIKDWIIKQMSISGFNSVKIKKELAVELFEKKKILPLLDGLDRLSTDNQKECIKAINELLQEDYQIDRLVVCSRIDEYEVHSCDIDIEGEKIEGKESVRLRLEEAIYLKPLTEEQIRDYFEEIKPHKRCQSIQEDPSLLELEIFKSPLFLGVLVLALAQEVSTEQQQRILEELIQCESEIERRDYLMTIFIEQMLAREINNENCPRDKQPSSKDTKVWLIQLAKIMKEMKEQSQEKFLIENMQPSWWLSEAEERAYSLRVRLVVGLAAGFTVGLYLGGWTHQLVVLFFAILSGVVTGAISYLFTKLVASFPKFVSQLSSKILPGLIFFVLMYSLSSLISIDLDLKDWNSLVWLTGIGVGVVFSGLSPSQIKAVDKLEFSKSRAIRCIGFALLLGIIFVPIHFSLDSELYTENRAYALYELFSFFLVGLVAGLIPGQEAQIELKLNPNQGIWKTLNYSVMWFVIGGLISGLFTVVMDGSEIIRATGISLTVGLLCGLIGSRNSGLVCIQHFILRVTLYYKKSIYSKKFMPWDYACFLNCATERRLLQKVGGGYKFWHPLLQEHFANKTSECSTEETY